MGDYLRNRPIAFVSGPLLATVGKKLNSPLTSKTSFFLVSSIIQIRC